MDALVRSRVTWARDGFVATARLLAHDAPTLCTGWTAIDLVGHLLVLRHDPVAWPGVALAAFSGITRRRMRAATADGYTAALDTLQAATPFLPPVFESPGSSGGHHVGEYVVHTEDLRRANALAPLSFDEDIAAVLWRRAVVVARQLRREEHGGIVLVRSDTGEVARAARGARTRVVRGNPLELLMWAHHRQAAVEVD